MKKLLLVLLMVATGLMATAQQKITGRSKMKEVKLGKVVVVPTIKGAPDLIIKEEVFDDYNRNNVIDADEISLIRFKIENLGNGVARAVQVKISLKNGNIPGLEFPSDLPIGDLNPGSFQNVEIPISTTMNLVDGNADFKFEVLEQSGFDAYPLEMRIDTHKFAPPLVVVADAQFSTKEGGIPQLNEKIHLTCSVQNIGKGQADSVTVQFILPGANCPALTDQSFDLDSLNPGQNSVIEFEFITTRNYKGDKIPVRIQLTESYRKFARDTMVSVSLSQELVAQNKVVIPAIPANESQIIKAYLTSVVDRNIPTKSEKNPNKFALIIGNEDYSKYQTGLQTEMNVKFARNDAAIMREYVVNTLGFEEGNVYFLPDATSGPINQKIEMISKLIKTYDSAELLFYYAGHGLPDETTHTPYLIPVDVNGSNLINAIRLSDIYTKFGQSGALRVTVILDACFSGGGRESGLLAARSVLIKPSEETISGNMVVFSASKGNQSALSYKNEKHGIFTYFLLKKLQETAGKISYGELADYLTKTVTRESLKINQKEQEPEVNVSTGVVDVWRSWKLND